MTNDLFDKVVEITEEYLGPAAPRFVGRHISSHLDKAPHELAHEDIPELVEWTRATFALLTSDKKIVRDYAQKISALADNT
jgi:hypothetical protein